VKLIKKRKEEKAAKTKIEDSKDDLDLKSLWPQLAKVVRWLIQNQFDKAIELMTLIMCRRRYEITRDTPHLDVEEELKENLRSLIEDESEVVQVQEKETENMVETIIERYLAG
jgi:hypothetical protein